MRRIILIVEFVFMVLSMELHAQYHDANWLVSSGYMGQGSNTLIHFPVGGGAPQISSTTGTIPFNYANASISDANGNFLFFSNGIEVFDKNYQAIPGCIIQTPYTIQWATAGLNRYNAGLFLPWPGDTNRYALFYCVPEIPIINTGSCPGGWTWLSNHLYYTVLDKSLNGGNGGIVSSSSIAYLDTLVYLNGLTAVKHGNGRDWWILTRERCSSNTNTVLFTNFGIQQFFKQSIGPNLNDGLKSAVSRFTPNGITLATAIDDTTIIFYKFDRCNGTLFDPIVLNTSPNGEVYSEFSPSSQLLYRNNPPQGIQTTQYDLNQYYLPNGILNSRTYIDPVADTGNCGQGVGSASSACMPSLAPDGKIYWGHCYACNLSVINFPDSLDTLCNMEYNTIQLPMPHSGALPQFPNFKLGPVVGSVCDSLTLISELNNISVSMYPSPVEEKLTITSQKLLQNVSIHLFDQMGRLVLDQNFSSGTVFQINIPSYIRSGLYVVQIHSEKGNVSRKVIVQK
ncbi:MAG: T9SS type A sorting domain-containing protein [Bacteroidia bacterium]